LRLHIGPEGICLEQGVARQLVPWQRITQVRIGTACWPREDFVEVHTDEGPVLNLHQFKRLDEIAREILKRIGTGVVVSRE
jgi:hypothetical protein